MSRPIGRRGFLGLVLAGGATAAATGACSGGNGAGSGQGNGTGGGNGAGSRRPSSTIAPPTATTRVVRLYSVVTPIEGGLYGDLLPDFEHETGYRVQLTGASPDAYGPARAGHADLVISHYGHKDAEAF